MQRAAPNVCHAHEEPAPAKAWGEHPELSNRRLDSRSLGVTLAPRSLASCLRGNDVCGKNISGDSQHPLRRLWRARLTLGILPIRVYQFAIAPLLPRNQCRFHPSCSQYA
ncbi:MAG: membrane protein insertion efficiency factor YidD, partial [Planctomycetes bacterium]|nr:membrane protein insertion efficiency factor YidD [Planctomycetota bacterium]